MQKLTLALFSAIVTVNAFSQDADPLQCVNPDVLNGLVFNGNSATKMTVSRALPDDMQGFQAPTGFELIGTGVRGTGLTLVAFKTAAPAADAYAALLQSLRADGWEVEDEQSPSQTFNISSEPVTGLVCRDAQRRVVDVRDIDGTRYAGIMPVPEQRHRECGAEDPLLTTSPGMRFENMRSRMPTFDLPESTRPAQGLNMGTNISGSGDTVSTLSHIHSPDTAAILAEHLAAQMAAKGWRRDAGWSGAFSAGSRWTQQSDDGPTWGTVSVVGVADQTYAVQFTLMTQPS